MSSAVLELTRNGTILTCGEALVAALPAQPVSIETGEPLRMFVGGAEANFAVGVSRLGLDVEWLGRVGDDPLGRFVTETLSGEGVDVGHVVTGGGPTGMYLREWLTDGERRPYYYRKGSAGSNFADTDWPIELKNVAWLHLTGITAALSASCRAVALRAIKWAREHEILISFDPNYRRQLWSPDDARTTLLPFLQSSQVVLMGADEAELLLGTNDPAEIDRRARAHGVDIVVVKLGAEGACAFYEGKRWDQAPFDVVAIDPVGAGDAFDAGFISGVRMGFTIGDSLRLGAYCGAQVASSLGENSGFPRLADIPLDVLPTQPGVGSIRET